MFRALTCPSSGGKIVFTQHLVSSLSVNVCTVHWLRADFFFVALNAIPTLVFLNRFVILLILGLWYVNVVQILCVRSQLVYCADVYRERRYQMLCEYNFSS